jgi:hypothetical protein
MKSTYLICSALDAKENQSYFLVLLVLKKITYLICGALDVKENQYVLYGAINVCEKHLFVL